MSVGNVDAAIERIRQRDPDAAPLVEAVADGLTAGEGTDAVHQAAVQQYLWVDVPAAWPDDAWDEIVAGAAILFDELGFDRYAGIARSSRTAEVLAAWRASSRAGRKAFCGAAGVGGRAPDKGLLTWATSSVRRGAGPHGGRAGLEQAIDAGDLTPGAAAWKAAAGEVTERPQRRPGASAGQCCSRSSRPNGRKSGGRCPGPVLRRCARPRAPHLGPVYPPVTSHCRGAVRWCWSGQSGAST